MATHTVEITSALLSLSRQSISQLLERTPISTITQVRELLQMIMVREGDAPSRSESCPYAGTAASPSAATTGEARITAATSFRTVSIKCGTDPPCTPRDRSSSWASETLARALDAMLAATVLGCCQTSTAETEPRSSQTRPPEGTLSWLSPVIRTHGLS